MSEDNNRCIITKGLAKIKKPFVKNKSSKKTKLDKILRICSFIFFIIFSFGILSILIILYKTHSFDSLAKVLSSLIAVIGVFAGFFFNKRQTYKEIVTKERIEWLHKMQENLSEYLKLTNSIMEKDIEKIVNEKKKAKLLIEEKKDKIKKLYYEIIFNINHKNDKKALDAIKNYNSLVLGELEKIRVNLAIKEGVKLELVAVAGEEGELLFKIKNESERNKIKDLIADEDLENILTAEDKYKNKDKDIDEKELPKEISLLRKEVSEEFTKIFNETWNRIKREAD